MGDKNNKNLGYRNRSRSSSSEFSDSDCVSDEDITWQQWFLSLRGNDFLCEIDEQYIADEFNLHGLSSMVPNYEYAIELILDRNSDDNLTEEQEEVIERNAQQLFGLIHARFIVGARGLQQMMEKFTNKIFGRCPRIYCNGQPVLPVGQSDLPNHDGVKLYCPKCNDIYNPRFSKHLNLDGAYFGTTFPHMLFLQYPNLLPQEAPLKYVPRIFGFRVSSLAYQRVNNNSNNSSNNNSSSSNNNNSNNKNGNNNVVNNRKEKEQKFQQQKPTAKRGIPPIRK